MFCRLGFVLERRPVLAVACPKVVWMRPSAAMACGSATRYVEWSFVSSRQRSTTATIRMQVADLGQHALVGRVARLALAVGGEPELLEQHLAELLRGADRELAAGRRVGDVLELLDLRLHAHADAVEHDRVDAHADVLHRRQHAHQRLLDVGQEARLVALLQPGGHALAQAHRGERGAADVGELLRPVDLDADAGLRQQVVERVGRAAGSIR